MTTHSFTLSIEGLPVSLFDEMADALVEARCDDATFALIDGAYRFDFDREGASLVDAIQTALVDLSRALERFRGEEDAAAEEARLWDNTLMDGLEDEPPYPTREPTP